MHSDVLLLKHKNPNRSQQAPPGWFSQVSWFFPASLAWKHLPAVRKAPPSKTTNPAPLFPSRWPGTSYICLSSLSIRPCNITQRETHSTSSSSGKARSQPLCARERWWQPTPALPAPCQEAVCAGKSLFRQARLQRARGSQILTTSHLRQMPKYGRAPASLRSGKSQALSSHHCISSPYSMCIQRLQPHLLLHCLLLPDGFSPFRLQASFPFLTPAVTRQVITSKAYT